MKKFQTSNVTKKFMVLGVLIFVAAFFASWLAMKWLKIDFGSAADWAGGLGAIFAILGIGWQTQLQFEREDRQDKRTSRPIGLDLAYRSIPVNEGMTFIYNSLFADSEYGENVDAFKEVHSDLEKLVNKRVGFIHFNLIGPVEIYNLTIEISSPSDNIEEKIELPTVKAGVDYLWLTRSALEKLHRQNTSEAQKSSMFPVELTDAVDVRISYMTQSHEVGTIEQSKPKGTHIIGQLKEPLYSGKQKLTYDNMSGFGTVCVNLRQFSK